MNFSDKLSKWECEHYQKHPLLSQVVTRTISALLVAGILWTLAKANPVITGERISNEEGRLTITNKGLLPLNTRYSVASDDTSIILPKEQAHVNIYPGPAKNIKILEINNLPGAASAVLEVKGPGSAQVTDVSGNTVILYPPEAKNIVGGNTVEFK